ncbi:hypothetical protein THRCLA_20557 [Thraustotheca clavata]|uniref:Uncharacterized protein n=1 Tax=Thraustotheca clavata TaxID=74557 RepID=A0A1W0A5W2_9STRA|nr:hypothetical protein THRCLA_20557 [Thraustotheca clavata]
MLIAALPSVGEFDQIQKFSNELNQPQTESNAFRVQSVVETSMLRQQLDQQYSDQIQNLTNQLNQLQTESNAFRVQSVAETSILRQQLDQQHSVAKHLKQMLKNISEKYTALQLEHKTLKTQLDTKAIELINAEERIETLKHKITLLENENTKLYQVEKLHITLQQDYQELTIDCQEWKNKVNGLENVQEENNQLRNELNELLQQHELANKRTHQIIKELRKSLQEERNKPTPEPILLPSPPLAVKCIYTKDGQEGSEIIQEFALRIEQLLQHNAVLTERVRFAEENTRLVAMDLERKRLLLNQMCHNINLDDKPQVFALAITKAAHVQCLETIETLLYKTLVDNLELKKCGFISTSLELEEPEISIYKAL